MTPCNRPRKLMSNASWLAFLASHPRWTKPLTAPCTLRAAAVASGAVAAGSGAVAAWFFLPRSAPPVGAWAPPAIPANPAEWATYSGTPVPEPSSLACMIVVIGVVLLAMWWAR